MMEDTIQEVIKDAHNMALHCADTAPDLLKWCFESIATRLERVCASGLYIAPKSVVETAKAAAADTPVDLNGKSLNAIFANPPFKAEDGFARLYHCDEIGLRLQRFKSPQCIRIVGYFQPVPKPGCGETIPDESKHVYEIAVDRDGEGAYTARAYCDRRQILSVTSTCKWTAEQGAVAALFRKLRHTCRKTRRNIAAARALAGEGK